MSVENADNQPDLWSEEERKMRKQRSLQEIMRAADQAVENISLVLAEEHHDSMEARGQFQQQCGSGGEEISDCETRPTIFAENRNPNQMQTFNLSSASLRPSSSSSVSNQFEFESSDFSWGHQQQQTCSSSSSMHFTFTDQQNVSSLNSYVDTDEDDDDVVCLTPFTMEGGKFNWQNTTLVDQLNGLQQHEMGFIPNDELRMSNTPNSGIGHSIANSPAFFQPQYDGSTTPTSTASTSVLSPQCQQQLSSAEPHIQTAALNNTSEFVWNDPTNIQMIEDYAKWSLEYPHKHGGLNVLMKFLCAENGTQNISENYLRKKVYAQRKRLQEQMLKQNVEAAQPPLEMVPQNVNSLETQHIELQGQGKAVEAITNEGASWQPVFDQQNHLEETFTEGNNQFDFTEMVENPPANPSTTNERQNNNEMRGWPDEGGIEAENDAIEIMQNHGEEVAESNEENMANEEKEEAETFAIDGAVENIQAQNEFEAYSEISKTEISPPKRKPMELSSVQLAKRSKPFGNKRESNIGWCRNFVRNVVSITAVPLIPTIQPEAVMVKQALLSELAYADKIGNTVKYEPRSEFDEEILQPESGRNEYQQDGVENVDEMANNAKEAEELMSVHEDGEKISDGEKNGAKMHGPILKYPRMPKVKVIVKTLNLAKLMRNLNKSAEQEQSGSRQDNNAIKGTAEKKRSGRHAFVFEASRTITSVSTSSRRSHYDKDKDPSLVIADCQNILPPKLARNLNLHGMPKCAACGKEWSRSHYPVHMIVKHQIFVGENSQVIEHLDSLKTDDLKQIVWRCEPCQNTDFVDIEEYLAHLDSAVQHKSTRVGSGGKKYCLSKWWSDKKQCQ